MYLAEKHKSPAYPSDLKGRARVNKMMDWFNANFYREYGYDLVYPQVLPHHMRQPENVNVATIEWGAEGTKRFLNVLNDHFLGKGSKFLCGGEPTIADYFGAAMLSLGELIGNDLAGYPNVARRLNAMKDMPLRTVANTVHNGFVEKMKDKSFVRIA